MLFFRRAAGHRDLNSFPGRRSSDLRVDAGGLDVLVLDDQRLDTIDHRIHLAGIVTHGFDRCARLAGDTGTDIDDIGFGIDAFTDRQFDNRDRKSTRLNSSHVVISYAVFCPKKKNILSDLQMEFL